MPWYKSGTVSVAQNSNSVVGTNTAFIANSRVGDGFRGPDGGWYEVTNIASDTAMSISPNYQGASNGSGSYALAPLQGYVKESADALRALVLQYGSVLAVLGPTGTLAGVRQALALTDTSGLPETVNAQYFTAARVRSTTLTNLAADNTNSVVPTDTVLQAFGKLQAQMNVRASKGANNDITSLSGLTTPLTVGQGGTGSNSQSGAREALAVRTGNVKWRSNRGALSLQAGQYYNIEWTNDVYGTGNIHNQSVSPENFVLPVGMFLITATLVYDYSPNGRRGIRLTLDGAPAQGGTNLVPVVPNGITTVQMTYIARITASGTILRIQGFQDTGNNLNMPMSGQGLIDIFQLE